MTKNIVCILGVKYCFNLEEKTQPHFQLALGLAALKRNTTLLSTVRISAQERQLRETIVSSVRAMVSMRSDKFLYAQNKHLRDTMVSLVSI